MAAGRPTKYTEVVHATIVDAIQEGVCKAHAAALAGITEDTLENWLHDERETFVAFALEVRAAEADYARTLIRRINRACGASGKRTRGDGNWKAAAWMLERRFPKMYGPRVDTRPERKAVEDRPFSPWAKPAQLPRHGEAIQ